MRNVAVAVIAVAMLFAPIASADCSWTTPISTSIMYTSNCNKVGIGGTTDPQDTLHLQGTPPYLRLTDVSSWGGQVLLGNDMLLSATNSDGTASKTIGAHKLLFGYDGFNVDYSEDTTAGQARSWRRTLNLTKQGFLSLKGSEAYNKITLEQSGSTNARMMMVIDHWAGMTLNADWAGSGFILDNTDLPGWMVNMQTRGSLDYFQVQRVPSGNYTHSDEVELLRLDASGNLKVKGSVSANGLDLAEWVEASDDLAIGTVVVVDPTHLGGVTPSGRPYDTSVAGVVAAKPGLILGEEGKTKEMIATTGRVKVRVDATRHPVKAGDLLVTSSKPGTAMLSVPVQIGDVEMHRPGTLIGKALEPLASGEGEILVLLSLQ
jgi:hypothetical protein